MGEEQRSILVGTEQDSTDCIRRISRALVSKVRERERESCMRVVLLCPDYVYMCGGVLSVVRSKWPVRVKRGSA